MKGLAVGLSFLGAAWALPGLGAEVRCATAESMAHLMEAWSEGFAATQPAAPARLVQRDRFSAEAFTALLHGEIDVAPFARELFPAERKAYAGQFGGEPLLVPIATGSRATKGGTHAIAIFVHENNPLAQLSLPTLRRLLSAGGGLTTWGQLGLEGKWAKRPIIVHGMLTRRETGNPPGIVNFLETEVLPGEIWRPDLREHGDQAGGPQALELIVRAVAADENAVGYSGFGYAVPGTKTLALGATAGGPFFAGTATEIARREYPLARRLYLCVRSPPSAAIRAFLDYALSPAGQAAVASTPEGFFPLPPGRQ